MSWQRLLMKMKQPSRASVETAAISCQQITRSHVCKKYLRKLCFLLQFAVSFSPVKGCNTQKRTGNHSHQIRRVTIHTDQANKTSLSRLTVNYLSYGKFSEIHIDTAESCLLDFHSIKYINITMTLLNYEYSSGADRKLEFDD